MPLKLPEKLYQSVASYIEAYYIPREQFVLPGAPQIHCCQIKEGSAEMEECCALPKAAMASPIRPAPKKTEKPCLVKAASLQEILKQTDAGFSETLLKQIDLTGKKDSEIYKRAGLTKQHFSKIRNNPDYKPTKATASALALALELDLDQTKDLIGRAGYALTNSSKFDLIVRFFIENRQFDIVQINIALYEFDQPLLGA